MECDNETSAMLHPAVVAKSTYWLTQKQTPVVPFPSKRGKFPMDETELWRTRSRQACRRALDDSNSQPLVGRPHCSTSGYNNPSVRRAWAASR